MGHHDGHSSLSPFNQAHSDKDTNDDIWEGNITPSDHSVNLLHYHASAMEDAHRATAEGGTVVGLAQELLRAVMFELGLINNGTCLVLFFFSFFLLLRCWWWCCSNLFLDFSFRSMD